MLDIYEMPEALSLNEVMLLVSKRVLITARSFSSTSNEPRKLLEDSGFELIWGGSGEPLSEEEMVERIQGIDAVIVGSDKMTANVIAAADRLKVISKHGVGIDNIDLKAATKRGIAVTIAPGSNNEAVAELTIGLLFAAVRKIPLADRIVRSGRWDRLVGYDIWGKNLGIIGMRSIGVEVAKRAKGLGMEIYYTDPQRNEIAENMYHCKRVDLKVLLGLCDFVSIHCPLTPSTRGLIGREELRLMKKEAFLINTARGGVVDEEALYEALQEGIIAGAALDVFNVEPPRGSRLLELDNVVVSPHMGSYTCESITKMSLLAAQNVRDILLGGNSDYQVNRV